MEECPLCHIELKRIPKSIFGYCPFCYSLYVIEEDSNEKGRDKEAQL